jgi:lipoprotein signal peptidase
MKLNRIIFVLSIILVFIQDSSAQIDSSSIISARLGNEIDKYERTYFGLFPSITNFVRAKISAGDQGSVQITIEREVHSVIRDSAITLDKIDVYFLKDYVEHFEIISMNASESDRVALTFKYKRLIGKGVMELRLISLSDPTEIIVTRSDRLRCEGVLLYADHQCVVLVKKKNIFAWNNSSAFAVIPVSEISTITYPHRGNIIDGFGKGFLIGFILSSFGFQSYGNSHNSGDEYIPGGAILLASSLVGLCGGWLGGIVSSVSSFTPVVIAGLGINYDQHLEALKKFCLYQNEIPPEIKNKIKSELRK